MSVLSRFETIEEEDKEKAVKFLVEHATPDFDFFFMIVLAVLMASFGLLAGSETIVIGSMLIAPLLYPILGISLGISMSDPLLVRHSLWTVIKASGFAVAASVTAALFFSVARNGMVAETPEIVLRTTPSLLLLAVAVVSGFAVSYALVKPKLSETLPGVAVSVALIPPLAVVGIGIAWLNASIALGALMVLLLNVLGIVAASMMSFSLMNVYGEKRTAHKALAQEKRRIEDEKIEVKKAEEASEKELNLK